jgi:hypothetical protein
MSVLVAGSDVPVGGVAHAASTPVPTAAAAAAAKRFINWRRER